MSNFHICKVINDRLFIIQDNEGYNNHTSVAGIQQLVPTGYIASWLPDAKAFGTVHKYINDLSLICDLHPGSFAEQKPEQLLDNK